MDSTGTMSQYQSFYVLLVEKVDLFLNVIVLNENDWIICSIAVTQPAAGMSLIINSKAFVPFR